MLSRWCSSSPRIALAIALCLSVAVTATAPAAASAPSTKQHVRGKVTRYWERQLHSGTDTFLLGYRIVRCGPRACVVRWHDRRFAPDDTFVEYKGTDACYAPKVRVRCFRRGEAPVATGP
jgi:hypothetical protein